MRLFLARGDPYEDDRDAEAIVPIDLDLMENAPSDEAPAPAPPAPSEPPANEPPKVPGEGIAVDAGPAIADAGAIEDAGDADAGKKRRSPSDAGAGDSDAG